MATNLLGLPNAILPPLEDTVKVHQRIVTALLVGGTALDRKVVIQTLTT
jgi:hypothetical protein